MKRIISIWRFESFKKETRCFVYESFVGGGFENRIFLTENPEILRENYHLTSEISINQKRE